MPSRQSSERDGNESTRLIATVCAGQTTNYNDEIRGRADKRTMIKTTTPHPHQMATTQDPAHTSGHQREGREAEIRVEAAFTTMQSAGRSSALYTGRHAFGGPGDWGGGREAEAEFESASEEREGEASTRGGQDVSFSFVFVFFVFGELEGRRSG